MDEVAKGLEVEIYGKLYRTRCAVLEMEEDIQDLGDGDVEWEVVEAKLEESRVESGEEGKRGSRRGKGAKGTLREKQAEGVRSASTDRQT